MENPKCFLCTLSSHGDVATASWLALNLLVFSLRVTQRSLPKCYQSQYCLDINMYLYFVRHYQPGESQNLFQGLPVGVPSRGKGDNVLERKGGRCWSSFFFSPLRRSLWFMYTNTKQHMLLLVFWCWPYCPIPPLLMFFSVIFCTKIFCNKYGTVL